MSTRLSTRIVTEVSAQVEPDRESELVAAFRALVAEPLPDGLLHTQLLRGSDRWRIQSQWRDQEALAAMRAATDVPAAPRLFRSVGAEPVLEIYEVVLEHSAPGTVA